MIVLFLLAIAADPAPARTTTEAPVQYKKRTLVDFSDVNIQGELRKPEGDFYGSRKRTRFNKLIKVRPNFVPEIVASTDNL